MGWFVCSRLWVELVSHKNDAMSYYDIPLGTAELFTLSNRRSMFLFQQEWLRAFPGVSS